MRFCSSDRRSSPGGRATGFEYLPADDIYLDSACQSLRPQPVQGALAEYYTSYGACGGRVKYAWGQKVDARVLDVRRSAASWLGLSRHYVTAFTLNTSYGINLLLQQLPRGEFSRVVTSTIEHNSVFLSTMTAARRLSVPRQVVARTAGGELDLAASDRERAVVVVNVVSNVDGSTLAGLAELTQDVHRRGGIVIVDAAQAAAHSPRLVAGTDVDAVCFSAHKVYGPSLGVVVAREELLRSLDVSFVGGGMVSGVSRDGFDLIPEEPWSLLEPGLQAWGEIIGLGAALDWLRDVKPLGHSPHDHITALSASLFQGLSEIPGLHVVNTEPAPVISVWSDRVDAHRLAVFLSQAGIMVRSGYFCAHYWLTEVLGLPPLLRFSLGLHNTPEDIDTAVHTLSKLLRGLR